MKLTLIAGLTALLLVASSVVAQQPDATFSTDAPVETPSAAESPIREMLDQARLDLVELRFEQALASLESLLARTDLTISERIEGWVVRSEAHVAFGDLAAAEEDYRQLLRLQPAFAPDASLIPGKAMERFRRVRGALVGQLAVELQPADAELSIDGLPIELTPGLELPMLVGEHRLRAERAGFDAVEQSVIVEAGKSGRVELRLVPNSRTVVVRTDPADVEVRIDGRIHGKTTAVIGADGWADARQPAQLVVENLPLGEHLIELSKACFRDKRFRELLTVDLVDWSPRVLAPARMAPVSATLVVIDGPVGADIVVDGERMSRTPSRPIELCPGERELEIRYEARRIWTETLSLTDDQEAVVRLEARPNLLLIGAEEWPAPLIGMASKFNFEGRRSSAGVDLSLPQSWSALRLADDVDLAISRRREAGRDVGWWIYSPHLDQLSSFDTLPIGLSRPDWKVVTWGLSLVDSDRYGPALVAEVRPGGAADEAGLRVGARLLSLGGSQVVSAQQAQRFLAVASASAPLDAEWVSQSGRTGRGQLQGRLSPSLAHAESDDSANALRAAWAVVDSVTGGERGSIARANLALLLAGRGMHSLAAERWNESALSDRAGIGPGSAAYYLGCAMQAAGRTSAAIDAFRRAADSKATAYNDAGPEVAAAARDRLRELAP